MSVVIIYTDGGSRGNPGHAGAAAQLLVDGNGHYVQHYIGPNVTNNVAEYEGVICGLRLAQKLGLQGRDLHIMLDSQLVRNQMAGEWKINDEQLRLAQLRAKELMAPFATVSFIWVPREMNKIADRLVNEAIDKHLAASAKTEPAFVSASCEGERCFCGEPAKHKVRETIFHDDPLPNRHPLTSYICHTHFRQIMGPSADA